MEKPLVTVVTITYNLINAGREKFIRQCIDCVHAQTYKNVEHIIIDGASTDGTLEIFKDYPWLKVFSEPDKGIYDAMNKGVAKASGKYIVFLNSDDFWHDNRAVEESVKALEENDADFSYSSAKYYDENEKFIGCLFPVMETFFLRMPFSHQSMFTKTKLVHFDDTYKSAGDYDFVLRLILSGAKGVFVKLDFTSFRLIGISSGLSDSGTTLSDNESIRSIAENLSKYGVTYYVAKDMFLERRIEADILKNIIGSVDTSLSVSIRNKYLMGKQKQISVFSDIPRISYIRKFRIKNFTLLRICYYRYVKVFYLLKYIPIFVLPI